MIDDIVKLAFEEGEAVVTGKPRISKALAATLRSAGIDYYLSFLVKNTDEATGGETYYAGFQTARIQEEGDRTYFVPVSVQGTGSWVLYAGTVGRMSRARVRRFREDINAQTLCCFFEIGGENYEFVVPYQRSKTAAIFAQGKPGRELEPLLTLFEAQSEAVSAYHAGKVAQEIERAKAVLAMAEEGLVQIAKVGEHLEIRGLPLHHHPYSLAASPETGMYYLVAEAIAPQQKQGELPDTSRMTEKEKYESRWLGGFMHRQSPSKPQAPSPYKLFTGRAEALEEVTGMRAGELKEPGWSYGDTFRFSQEGHPMRLVIAQYFASNKPVWAVLEHYAGEEDSTPASKQSLQLLLAWEDIRQQTRRHLGLPVQTGSPDSPVFRYEVRQ